MSRLLTLLALTGRLALGLGLVALAGCSLFRQNPLEEKRGALVLIIDTRTAGNMRDLRKLLADNGARATVFVAGQITRGSSLALYDLRSDGNEIGLSGLKGVDPQLYSRLYGQQKYFQDEIVTQVLGAKRNDLNPRYFLIGTLSQTNATVRTLPAFLKEKGFSRIVHKMPDYARPYAKPASRLSEVPVLYAYAVTAKNVGSVDLAEVSRRNEILVVYPDRQSLPQLLSEARKQNIPFATIADLGKVGNTP